MNTSLKKAKLRAFSSYLGCCLVILAQIGAYVILPVLVPPLSQKLGVSIGQVSLFYTFSGASAIVVGFVFGKLIQVLPLHIHTTMTGIILSVSFLLLAVGDNLFTLYLAGILYGYCTSAGAYSLAQMVIMW